MKNSDSMDYLEITPENLKNIEEQIMTINEIGFYVGILLIIIFIYMFINFLSYYIYGKCRNLKIDIFDCLIPIYRNKIFYLGLKKLNNKKVLKYQTLLCCCFILSILTIYTLPILYIINFILLGKVLKLNLYKKERLIIYYLSFGLGLFYILLLESIDIVKMESL